MRHLLCGPILVVLASGCALDGTMDTSSDESQQKTQDFSYDDSFIRTDGEISVCWRSDANVNATEKAWVKSAVEGAIEEFSGIEFTGWGSCGSGSADVPIDVSNDNWPAAYLGTSAPSVSDRMFLNFFEGEPRDLGNNTSPAHDFSGCWSGQTQFPTSGDTGLKTWSTRRQYCIETIAVHEFFHAIGVTHEQNSALNNTSCPASAAGTDMFPNTTYGYWDLVSVSNYCSPIYNGDGILSPLDVSGLGMLYGQPHDDQMWHGAGSVRELANHNADAFLFKMLNYDVPGGANPKTGDFNGDGKTDIILEGPGSQQDKIRFANSAGNGFTISTFSFPSSRQLAIADFNGDGEDDILFHSASGGQNEIWSGTASKSFNVNAVASMPGSYQHKPVAGDFDGDGYGDIYWQKTGTTNSQMWFGRADGGLDVATNVSNTSGQPFVGDFNGDGRDDMYFYTPGTAQDTLRLSGAGRTSGYFHNRNRPEPGTALASVGDFDDDGVDDIIWNFPDEMDVISLFSGSAGSMADVPTSSILGDGEAIPLAGDYNGDGKTDVFWYTR